MDNQDQREHLSKPEVEQLVELELVADEHNTYIEALVNETAARLDQAHTDAFIAQQRLESLMSSAVYDVELAEADGGDALAEIKDAARHLRNAQRIISNRQDMFKACRAEAEQAEQKAKQVNAEFAGKPVEISTNGGEAFFCTFVKAADERYHFTVDGEEMQLPEYCIAVMRPDYRSATGAAGQTQ